MTRRPMGECTVCGRKNLSLVWHSNKHRPTVVRVHTPKPHSTTVQDWCTGSGRPPKGTP